MAQFEWLKNKKDVKIKTKAACDRAKCYNSMQWRNLSRFYKMEHPLCELCLLEGKINPVEHVHHYLKFNDLNNLYLLYALLTDQDNIISVCQNCHSAIHMNLNELTENQKKFLKDKKEQLFKKYLLMDMPILLTDDSNIEKNADK